MSDQSLIEYALNTLSTIFHEEQRYGEANDLIRKIEPDFPATMLPINGTCSASVVKLLDAILGDGIASYFLYEAVGMNAGGRICETDGREWPIRSLDDVKAYVLREKTA